MPNSIGCLGTYKIVCCECKKIMGIKMINEERMVGKVSHSFCSECAKEQIRAIKNSQNKEVIK